MYLIKIGSVYRPAGQEDFDDMRERLLKAKGAVTNSASIVTHHEVTSEFIRDDATIIWKIGDKDSPATPDDIEAFEKELFAAEIENRPVVWNHAISVEYMPHVLSK